MISCNVIATGSTGNAVLLSRWFLFDCGVPARLLEPYMDDFRLVFLTHEHGDHFKASTIRRLAQLQPALLFVCGSHMIGKLEEAGIPFDRVIVVDPGDVVGVRFHDCHLEIENFALIHNVENVGWKVKIIDDLAGGEATAMYATDTQYIPVSLPGLDLYMIEANYRVADIEARIAAKEAEGVYPYEKAVIQNHMSEETCKAWLRQNMGRNSRAVFLHQHKED